MAYVNDGTVHYDGIGNEEFATNWLNEQYKNKNDVLDLRSKNIDITKIKFSHLGTTQYHADVVGKIDDDVVATISVKKKDINAKGKPVGTFDLLNSTLTEPATAWIYKYINPEKLIDFRNKVISLKGKLKELPPNHPLRLEYINTIDESFQMDDMDSANECIKIIQPLFQKSQYLMIVGVSKETKTQSVIWLAPTSNPDGSPFFNFTSNNEKYVFIKGNGKGSRTIKQSIQGKVSKNYIFRLRVLLNNSLSPLLGLSQANSTSSWVVHIQVDGVFEIMGKMKKYLI